MRVLGIPYDVNTTDSCQGESISLSTTGHAYMATAHAAHARTAIRDWTMWSADTFDTESPDPRICDVAAWDA